MIRTASVLIAMKQTSEAENLLRLAEKTHRRPSDLLEVKAALSALRGRWEESKNFARQSLGKDHSKTSARMTLIRAMIETGDSNAALAESRRLMEETPPNEETLFLLARAANAAGSAAEEIIALEKLVELGRKKSEPLGASLTYLGQAYGKNGERGNAMKTLQEALQCPELTDPQRSMIQEIIDHLGIPSRKAGG
jgi:tetratricopeptide (TPR) repeat protein